MGLVEGVICLLFVVVSMSDSSESEDGRYEAILSVKSEMFEVDAKEKVTVAGRDRPGKDESKTFTFGDAILSCD